MKREKLFLNSKMKIVMTSAIFVIAILASCILVIRPSEESVEFDTFVNIGRPYSRVAETEYEFDSKTKIISFSENINYGSFVISDNPDGIVEGDEWIIMNDEKTYNVAEAVDDEISGKVYVYYMAGATSTITTLDSSATTYTISSGTEFATFATTVNSGNAFSGKTVVLLDNIDRGSAGIIGTSSKPFSGTFDGAGYTISGVNISGTAANTGVFGYVSNGTIKNVTVKGTLVKGGDGTGALAGYMSGTILNCKNKVDTVNGTKNVGGLVGKFSGTIKYCENYGVVATTSEAFAGGIIGSLIATADVFNCTNKGAITSKGNDAGGIVGTTNTYPLTLKYCVNSGIIKSTGSTAGGIVASIQAVSSIGSVNNIIENCKNTGDVISGAKHAAGILGWMGKYSSAEIRNCVNEAAISATTTNAGGIVAYGHTDGIKLVVEKCFNSNDIVATQGNSGGIVGIAVGQSTDFVKISCCGNDGNISISTGTSTKYYCTAGIAGNVGNALIEYCYNAGNVTGYGDLAGLAVFKSEKGGTVKNCYVSGIVQSTHGSSDAGVVLSSGVTLPTCENNCFKGTYYDTTNNNMYRQYKSGWSASDDNVTSFSTYSTNYSENNYGILEKTSDWVLKWQVPPTILSNPYDVYQAPGTTATLETIVYGAMDHIQYQWYVANSATGTGTAISKANASKYNAKVESSDKYYYCIATGIDSTGATATARTQSALVKSGLNTINTEFNLSAKSITIDTQDELINFAELVNAGYTFDGVEVLLGANISASSLSTPIGSFTSPFKGTFDGRGYVISDIAFSGLNYIALFGCVENATIKNLTVSGTSISGTNYIGGIVGYGSGILENLQNNIPITGTGTDIGGIAGEFEGTVRYCKNMATVTGVTNTGGITGESLGEITVFNCENQGNITSTGSYTAGIVAKSTGAVDIRNCVNNGEITATNGCVGGILGYACFNSVSTTPLQYIGYCRNNKTVKATAGADIGGIAGKIQSVKIEYCINKGTTVGVRRVGGIVGYTPIGKNIIQYCQNHMEVSALGGQVGGIAGQMEGLSSTDYAEVWYSANKARVLGWQGRSSYKEPDCGGIVGYMVIGHVEGCYLLVAPGGAIEQYYGVYGYRYIGGIVGAFDQGEAKNNSGIREKNTVKNCYVTGRMGIYDGGSTQDSKPAIANWVWYSSYPTGYAENNYFNGGNSSGKYYARWVEGNLKDGTNPTVSATSFIESCGGIYHTDTYNLNTGKQNSTEDWVLTWEAKPIVIRNPFNVIKPIGSTATLDLVENGALTEMSYQWYIADKEDGTGREITGSNASTYNATVQSSPKWYYCKITGVDSTGASVTTYTERAVVGNGEFVQEISECTVILNQQEFVYNGKHQEPSVIVKNGEYTLVKGAENDYIVSYENNIDAGTATVKITGKGNYIGTKSLSFTISKKNLTTTWEDASSFVYNGAGQAPNATANTGVDNESVTLSRTVYIDVGKHTSTATLFKVTGGQGKKDNYTLSNATKEFNITKRAVTFTAKDVSKTYDGNALTWENAVSPGYTISGTGLVSGHQPNVTRSGSITNVGTATHKIDSVVINNGSTDVTKNYNVTKTNGTLTVIAQGSATFDITLNGSTTFTYNGQEHKPEVTVKVGSKSLEKGTDYTVSYENNINASENGAKVIVNGKGNYAGSSGTKKFTINKKNLTITTKSISKVYDGKLLKYTHIAEPRYTFEGLAERDELTVETSGQILNVGSVNHEASYSIKVKSTGSDSSTNYNVTITKGKLSITSGEITGTVVISGEIAIRENLTANLSIVPNDCKISYSWWYTDTKTLDKVYINGETKKNLEIKDTNLLGKIIGVTVTLSRTNYNSLTIEAQTSGPVTLGKNKNILMERNSANLNFVIGAKRANEQTGNSSYLNYTANKINSIKIIDTNDTNAPTTFEASWDVTKDYGENRVIAWLVANGNMYDLYIGSDGIMEASSGTNLFANYTNCTSITGLENLDTSTVESMTNMFADCSGLSSLEVEKLSTGASASMKGMFKNCSNLTALNLSKLKTIRVTNMSEMFAGCSKLTGLDVKNLKTVNVTDMSAMFRGCSALTSIDVDRFDTSNVRSFANMFNSCSSLTCIRLEKIATVKANTVEGMFDGCSSLSTLVLGKNFKKIDGANMFRNCSALKRIIAKSETAMTFATNTGFNAITNAKIYVEKKANLSKYSSVANYSALYEAGRVRAMLEIVGDNPANVTYGETYTDAGATVAGWAESEKAEYEKLGYTLTTTGLPVNTDQVGKHHVIYTLKYSAQTIDTATN